MLFFRYVSFVSSYVIGIYSYRGMKTFPCLSRFTEIMFHNMTADKGVISPECFVKVPIRLAEEPYKDEGCDYCKQYVYNLNIYTALVIISKTDCY